MRSPFIAVSLLLSLVGCRGKAPSEPVNLDFSGTYQTASAHLQEASLKPDEAITALESLRKKETDNAMTAYLLADAYAKKQDWDRVLTELKRGNSIPACVQYVDEGIALEWVYPGYARARDLARACASAAPGLGVERGAILLNEARAMAKHIAESEPRSSLGVLVGIALTAIVDKGLEDLYGRAGRMADAQQAAGRRRVFKEWGTGIKNEIKASMAGLGEELPNMVGRSGMTQEEFTAILRVNHAKDASQKRAVEALNKEIVQRERAIADRALMSWPKD
jgi:hypothetical protein